MSTDNSYQIISDVYNHKKLDTIPFFICNTSYWLDGVAKDKYPIGYFDSAKIMTDYQLRKIEFHQTNYDDCYIPFLFPWYGTGVIPSALGCDITFVDGGDPAVSSHVINSPNQIKDLNKPDYYKDGLLPKVLNTIDYMVQNTDLPISFTDPQGPLNIAICLAGLENLFLWMYTNPNEVHDLMEFCTEVFIEWVKLQQKHIGNRHSCFPHGIILPKEFGNVWIADDDCVVISSDMYKEFVVPYNSKIFRAFNGGTLHFCGSAKHQIENFLNTDYCVGINNFCMGDFEQLRMMQDIYKDKMVLMACDFTPSNVDDYYTKLLNTLDKQGTIIGTYYADNYALKYGKYEMINRNNEETLKAIYDILKV